MVLNATFNNISVISWRSALLAEESTDLSQVTDKLYHIMLYTSPWSRLELTSVVMDSGCRGSCKFRYHTITATTVPLNKLIIIYICRNKMSGYVMLKEFDVTFRYMIEVILILWRTQRNDLIRIIDINWSRKAMTCTQRQGR
jgi:hypothetical protein